MTHIIQASAILDPRVSSPWRIAETTDCWLVSLSLVSRESARDNERDSTVNNEIIPIKDDSTR